MNPVLVDNVAKSFRRGAQRIAALAGVTLTVGSGDFLAVMGASGSGKSTLLHLVAGLTMPDSGAVLIDGQNLSRMSDRELTTFRRRRVGLVFQAFNLIPTLTAAQNIALPLMLEGRPHGEVQAKVDALVGSLGLGERRDHRPDVMSGGEQQRVAIGRALVTDPAVVLADEPTGNLDSVSSRAVCQLLRSLCVEQGRTIVMVTHEPTVAAFARRVAVMKDGRIVDSFDTPAEGDGQAVALRYQEAVRRGS